MRGLTVMLEKIAHCVRVDKLRAILLMEADFNFANKLVFGKKMVDNMEGAGVIPPEAMGSRKDMVAIEVLILRRIIFDLSCAQRQSGCLASVDAKTCYDQVTHSITSMIFQALGVELGETMCLRMALACMTFHIRTAHGDSDQTYGGSLRVPFQGLVQRNGGAPTGWLAVSIFLIYIQRQSGHILDTTSAINLSRILCCALMYVDNTDIPMMAREGETLNEVIQQMQAGVDS